jgi:hypothetical protein
MNIFASRVARQDGGFSGVCFYPDRGGSTVAESISFCGGPSAKVFMELYNKIPRELASNYLTEARDSARKPGAKIEDGLVYRLAESLVKKLDSHKPQLMERSPGSSADDPSFKAKVELLSTLSQNGASFQFLKLLDYRDFSDALWRDWAELEGFRPKSRLSMMQKLPDKEAVSRELKSWTTAFPFFDDTAAGIINNWDEFERSYKKIVEAVDQERELQTRLLEPARERFAELNKAIKDLEKGEIGQIAELLEKASAQYQDKEGAFSRTLKKVIGLIKDNPVEVNDFLKGICWDRAEDGSDRDVPAELAILPTAIENAGRSMPDSEKKALLTVCGHLWQLQLFWREVAYIGNEEEFLSSTSSASGSDTPSSAERWRQFVLHRFPLEGDSDYA